jgi:hypothetical protein
MNAYKKQLLEKKRILDTEIHSNHTGVNYDLKTIIDPRRFKVATQPGINLVHRSLNAFNF